MKHIFYVGLLLTLMHSQSISAAEERDSDSEAKRVVKAADGATVIKIDAETQMRMGLKVENLKSTEFTPQIKWFGRVLDPAPLQVALNEIDLANANLVVSQKELERLKLLREQNNASARAFEAGQAAFLRDKLAVQAATQKLQLLWGKELADNKRASEVAQSIVAGGKTLVRIDRPPDDSQASWPKKIRVSLFRDESMSYEGELVGAATTIDPATQNPGLLFVVDAGYDKLPINANVSASISTGGPLKGFLIPKAAVILHDGESWFYRQNNGTEFHRQRIENVSHSGTGNFIRDSENSTLSIVTTGAQQLLSEELKSQIKAD